MNLENNQEFFAEGLRSYMDAMLALGQFCQEVKKKADRVLTSNLEELERALGVPLKDQTQEIYVNPRSPTSFSETWAWIATRLSAPQFKSVLFGLAWEEVDSEIVPFVVGGFWFKNAADRDRAKQALGGDNALLEDGSGFYLRERLTPKEAASFEKKLEYILNKWIKLWRGAGGLRGAEAGHS